MSTFCVVRSTTTSFLMPAFLPEVTADGLILWRLRRTPEQQLWCAVSEFAGELALTVHDVATDQMPVAETYWDIESLVSRAEALRDQFLAAGWEAVDVDLDEPD